MSLVIHQNTDERRGAFKEFRSDFIEKIPVGSHVFNTNLITDEGEPFTATTQAGGIYDSSDTDSVNVIDIQGVKGSAGVWTAGFIKKLTFVLPK